MKGKKVLNKKIYIYTRTYEERAAQSQPCLGTPGDWHPWGWAPQGWAPSPRELLPHTVQSPRTGGTKGVAQGSSRPEQRSNAFWGGSHLHCPPVSSLQRPQGRAQCWGGSQHPLWWGEITAWGAAKVGGASPGSLP